MVVLLSWAEANGTTWHVRKDGTGDFTEISAALGPWVHDGDTILVGPGTYGIRDDSYYLRKAVHIIGESGPQLTIIHNEGYVLNFQPASTGFDVRDFSGAFSIRGFTFSQHLDGEMGFLGDGIWVENASGVIADNIFYANEGYGVMLKENSSVIVENNLFYLNEGCGLAISGDVAPSQAVVRNNTFVGDGIEASYSDCQAAIEKNILYLTALIWSAPVSNVTIECNDVWNPEGSRYSGIGDQTGVNGNISADPLFCGVAGSGNYYLQWNSPCAEPNVPAACSGHYMGCFPVLCTVGTKDQSWGSMKSLFDGKK